MKDPQDMEWAEFFHYYGNLQTTQIVGITIEDLYCQFVNRLISTHSVYSPELLEPAEIKEDE